MKDRTKNFKDPMEVHGELSLYDNGNLKWKRSNKITYAGRAYMLRNLCKSMAINYPYADSPFNDVSSSAVLDMNSHICCAAFGSGGKMDGSILPKPTRYADTKLYKAEPIVEAFSLFGDFNEEVFSDYIMYAPSFDYKMDEVGTVLNASSIYNNSVDLFFKKFKETSQTGYETIETDGQEFISSFVTFSIEIKGTEFSKATNGISEMGLFLGSIKKRSDLTEDLDPRSYCQSYGVYSHEYDFKDPTFHISQFVDGSAPVMFSHVSFPVEVIDETSNLIFKYSLFV
jgi:hypothetical protein